MEIYKEVTTTANGQPKRVINQAAADWVYRNNDLTEPWLFEIAFLPGQESRFRLQSRS